MRQRPHILLVTQTLGPGGAERQVAHLATGLATLGYPVTLACLGDAPGDLTPIRAAGARIVELGGLSVKLRARALPRFVRLARGADVVICSSWDATFWGRVGAIAARRPVAVIEHAVYRNLQTSSSGRPRGRWIALHNRLLDPLTYATVACAEAQRAVLRSEGVAERKTVLIPNGVPVARLREASRAGSVTRAELGIPAGARVVAHVARLTALKNQDQTLATVRALRERLGEVHVLLIGPGEEQERLERATRDEPWAHLLGARDDVPALLALADLAVLPSRAEAMPMVIAETIAVGVPIVGYDVGDVGAILRRTGAGVAVAAGDGEAFTAACAELLSSPALEERLRRAAEAAASEFDALTMAARYGQLAEAAAAGRPPRQAEVDAVVAQSST
jgi:glycosyltransferase involved in cell wall biosynthesis